MLTYRPLTTEDAAAVESLGEDYTAHRNEWIYHPPVEQFLSASLAEHGQTGGGWFGIMADGSLVGVVKITYETPDTVSFDYMLGAHHRGCGILTRVLRRIIADLSHKVELFKISCDKENDKSTAVPKRLGFSLEKEVPRSLKYTDTDFGDLVTYVKHNKRIHTDSASPTAPQNR